MKANGVHPRRYFYPLITAFEMYRDLPSASAANLPIARTMADQVLCLPIYPDLDQVAVARVLALLQPS
jgi:dTDP-4-amino-4,6-dideoxygalactose transaminase